MQTLADLIDLMDQLRVLDPKDNMAGETVTPEIATKQLNRSYRRLAMRALLHDPKISLTLSAGEPTYNMRTAPSIVGRKIIRPLYVVINGSPLYMRNGATPGLWSFAELDNDYSGWRTHSDGTPTRALVQGWGTLRLDPAPTQAIVDAGNNFINGIYLPDDMVEDTDFPDFPEEFHELVAYDAHVTAHTPTASEKEQWNRLQAYASETVNLFEEFIQAQRSQLQESGSVQGTLRDDWMEM